MSLIRAQVIVSGRVQGVFFRDSTRQAALKVGITGWVSNLPDGRVEALLEGEQNCVNQVIEFMKRGPQFARVDQIEVHCSEPSGEFENFSIRRNASSRPAKSGSSYTSVISPCTKVCTLDSLGEYCLGCHRTVEEITNWTELTDEEKSKVISACAERRGL